MEIKGYKINHAQGAITITKDFNRKASLYNSDEYILLNCIRRDHPEYTVNCGNIIKKKKDKRTYRNLTFANMRAFISITTKGDERKLDDFDYTLSIAKTYSGSYGRVKEWFLNEYPNYANNEMFKPSEPSDEAKQDISSANKS